MIFYAPLWFFLKVCNDFEGKPNSNQKIIVHEYIQYTRQAETKTASKAHKALPTGRLNLLSLASMPNASRDSIPPFVAIGKVSFFLP